MRMDKLIAATHGRDAARAYRSYVLQPHQRDRAGEIGQDVLRYFARVAGACTGLSAVYATALRGMGRVGQWLSAIRTSDRWKKAGQTDRRTEAVIQ